MYEIEQTINKIMKLSVTRTYELRTNYIPNNKTGRRDEQARTSKKTQNCYTLHMSLIKKKMCVRSFISSVN